MGTVMPYRMVMEDGAALVLLGPYHSVQIEYEWDRRRATRGDVTILKRGSTFGRDPGLLEISNCENTRAFESALRDFTKKRMQFT